MKLGTLWNIVRVMTPRRVAAMISARLSCVLSSLTGRVYVAGAPFSITIEPTNRCNLRCPECPSGAGMLTRPLGTMETEVYEKILDQVSANTWYLNLYFQGEPFLHRDLFRMIDAAHKRRMYVCISTNAHLIDAETADRIVASNVEKLIVSVDGLDEESYSAYRVGGSLQRVLEGIEFLRDAQTRRPESRTEVVLQCLITKQNEHQIPDFMRLAGRMHAGTALKTMQVYSMESAEKFLPVNEKYRRYNTGNGRLEVKSGQKNRCVALWERCIITWDGTIVPCCFDKDAGHPIGAFPAMSMKEAWVSPMFQAFRKRILSGRSSVDMCANCTEGLRIYR